MSKRNLGLLRRLNRALADGADITIDWLTTIVVVAKRNWKVKEFTQFHKHLNLMFRARSIQIHNDMEKLLKNCWFYRTV